MYNKDLTSSVKDFKRPKKQDVNFKSLTRDSTGQRDTETRRSCSKEM